MDTVVRKEATPRPAMWLLPPRVAELVATELVKLGLPFSCGPRCNNVIALSVDESRRSLLNLLVERMTRRANR